jgi:hypothetical protein
VRARVCVRVCVAWPDPLPEFGTAVQVHSLMRCRVRALAAVEWQRPRRPRSAARHRPPRCSQPHRDDPAVRIGSSGARSWRSSFTRSRMIPRPELLFIFILITLGEKQEKSLTLMNRVLLSFATCLLTHRSAPIGETGHQRWQHVRGDGGKLRHRGL